MYSCELSKPDGRQMTLYSHAPVRAPQAVPSPEGQLAPARPHLRWHPLRGEWVAYAAYRQHRTFLPPPEFNPFAVSRPGAAPTELPPGDYEIAVFDNRFPALAPGADTAPALALPTAPARGRCEVLVYSQDPAATLGGLPLARLELLLEVWAERSARCAAAGCAYVMPFENRGAEVGVTLHHPHGQLYGYPFVPPVPARMLASELAHYLRHGSALLTDMAAAEAAQGERLLYLGEHALAFVPACARYPYEVWLMPRAPVASFAALTEAQRRDLARALKTVLLRYEGLWQRPFPYLMAWFQAPSDGLVHPETQLHAEFYPPYRSRDRLKYLAGTELAAGMFVMDALPEDGAAQLRQVDVTLEPA